MSLKKKTQAGIGWSTAEQLTSTFVTFLVQILLARLLPPEEFGILATVSIFILIANLLADGGFGDALVQSPSVTRVDISSVFYFNLFLSILMIATLSLAAPQIALFFNEPRLASVVPVLCWTLVISASYVTQQNMLIRNFQFGSLFRISIPSQFAGGVVGIVMALNGCNVWSLVGQVLTTGAIASIICWCLCKAEWQPRREFSVESLKRMFPFGIGILGSRLVTSVTGQAYGLVIGKLFTMTDLAYYDRANRLQLLPARSLISPLSRVLFPVFSSIQSETQRIASALRRGIPLLCFIVFPGMFLLMVIAEPLIVVLLTEKWLPAAEYLKIFPLVGMVIPIQTTNYAVIRALGASRLFFIITALRAVMIITVLFLTYRWGVSAIIWGQIFIAWFGCLLNAVITSRLVGYAWTEQLACIAKYFLLSFFVAAITVLWSQIGPQGYMLRLAFECLVYVSTFWLIAWLCKLEGVSMGRDFAIKAWQMTTRWIANCSLAQRN